MVLLDYRQPHFQIEHDSSNTQEKRFAMHELFCLYARDIQRLSWLETLLLAVQSVITGHT